MFQAGNKIESTKNTISNRQFVDIAILYLYIFIAFGMCVILPEEQLSTALYYSAIILSAVFFAALAEKSKTTFEFKMYITLSFLILFLTFALRSYTAIDDPSYIRIFNDVTMYGWFYVFRTETIEPGYLILNNLISQFTSNYLYMQITTSFVPLFLFYRVFVKFRHIISLPMAIFLLITMLYFQMLAVGLLRMFIALGIVLNALPYIVQRNATKYVLLVLIAGFFHYSSLFMLLFAYFALKKDYLSKRVKRFLIIGFIATPFIFMGISKFLVPLMGERYAGYAMVNDFSFSILSFDTVPLLILLLLFYNKIDIKKLDYYKLFMSVFAVSFIVSFYSSMVSLGRLIFYANSAFFIAAPMACKALNRDSRRFFLYFLIIVYGFLYLYKTQFALDSHIPYLFPYHGLFIKI
ncbi:EpsG family protein [Desulfallas thermosapovorans]|uniref:EpsG-like putative glucosyltransferase n=1 Tax=Desulfallas thermosapovorans DSM 6562 TaxID=1121431 RepID=A0A5S4ZMT8_9FIRM|nr:EpsG family protein [Desulfallas thermosapovorans]TYO93241.1 EpsG-like putative glucosyltransferase [Desulfallas thermosapovorans DSM 6562]